MFRKIAPSPKGYPLLGNFLAIRKDPINFFVNSVQEFGDLVRFKLGFLQAHIVTNPEHIKYVLQDNNRNYNRQTLGHNRIRTVLGNGLVNSDGAFWLRQRRIAQPAFHRQKISAFADLMVKNTVGFLEKLEIYATNSQVFNIEEEMLALTLKIVSQTLFSTEVDSRISRITEAVTVAMRHINNRITNPFSLPESIPTKENVHFRKMLTTLDKTVYDIIQERRNNPKEAKDLLSMLMTACDEETGEMMNNEQLRDEVMTMFLAGHETTASSLTWTWYLLSKNPIARRCIQQELKDVLAERLPTFEDLPKLQYTQLVVKESLRIYPSVWLFLRSAIEDDEIAGYHIPAKSIMILCPYITHRDNRFWENPEGFDPERFALDKITKMPRFAYFPFGGGPHICIGNEFAMMEIQLILATVMQKYQLDLLPGQVVEIEPLITIRPRHGLMMKAKKL
jgi:cytochrome P450